MLSSAAIPVGASRLMNGIFVCIPYPYQIQESLFAAFLGITIIPISKLAMVAIDAGDNEKDSDSSGI
jgi:hypothetical protein